MAHEVASQQADPESDEPLISGKVARLLNSRELVINRGSEHGVEQGMQFVVLDDYGAIKDPDTDETIGELRREKVHVQAVEVFERMTVARTYRVTRRGQRGFPELSSVGGLSSFIGKMSTPDEYETLKAALGSRYQSISEDESLVKVGDVVEQLRLTEI